MLISQKPDKWMGGGGVNFIFTVVIFFMCCILIHVCNSKAVKLPFLLNVWLNAMCLKMNKSLLQTLCLITSPSSVPNRALGLNDDCRLQLLQRLVQAFVICHQNNCCWCLFLLGYQPLTSDLFQYNPPMRPICFFFFLIGCFSFTLVHFFHTSIQCFFLFLSSFMAYLKQRFCPEQYTTLSL